MGIQTTKGTGVGVEFFGINLKEGCFQQSIKGEGKKKFEAGNVEMIGVPYRFSVSEDEYEGQKSIKANLFLHDIEQGQPNMCVSWTIFTEANEANATGLSILAKLYAADLTNPVVIKPWFAPQGQKLGDSFVVESESGMSGVRVDTIVNGERQKIEKGDYAGHGDKLPAVKEIPIPGTKKVHKSKEEWNSIMEAMVANLAARFAPADKDKQAANDTDAGVDPAEVAAMRARA